MVRKLFRSLLGVPRSGILVLSAVNSPSDLDKKSNLIQPSPGWECWKNQRKIARFVSNDLIATGSVQMYSGEYLTLCKAIVVTVFHLGLETEQLKLR